MRTSLEYASQSSLCSEKSPNCSEACDGFYQTEVLKLIRKGCIVSLGNTNKEGGRMISVTPKIISLLLSIEKMRYT
ncbi:hypothetical protein ABEB36_003737 [Hypothenemus hampei]|uniref:Uncharacterized protein n=1 Tax=Hypothenemus hampei TaxID=57062 RepID=A0ABD1F425_HYPHA